MYLAFPKSLSVSLYAVRAIVVQAMVIGHGLNFAGVGFELRPPNFPFIQNICVLIFAFLSGMVICQSIQTRSQRGEFGYLAFMVDRAVRFSITIIPCLIAIFFLDQMSVLNPSFGRALEGAISFPQFLGNVLMLQTHPYFSVAAFGTARPLWSVALVWWTCVFFGFLFLFQQTKRKEVLLLLPVFALSLPMVMTSFVNGRGLALVWLLGAVSSYLVTRLPRLSGFFNWIIALGALALMSPYFYRQLLTMRSGYSMAAGLSIALFLFCVFYFVSHAKSGDENLFAKAAKFLSSYSFTLFCIHFSVFTMLQFTVGRRGWVFILAGLLISNALSLLIASVTEMRYKRIRDWIVAKFIPPSSQAELPNSQR